MLPLRLATCSHYTLPCLSFSNVAVHAYTVCSACGSLPAYSHLPLCATGPPGTYFLLSLPVPFALFLPSCPLAAPALLLLLQRLLPLFTHTPRQMPTPLVKNTHTGA